MKLRLAIGTFVALLAVAGWFAWRPLRLPTRQLRVAPFIPLRDAQSAVLLLVDEAALRVAEPRREAERRSELEWINLLQQRFGGCDVQPVTALAQDGARLLHERMLIVIPHPLSGELDSTLAPLFDAAVRDGSDVLLEAPFGFWSRRLGLPARGTEQRSHLNWPATSSQARRLESLVADPQPLPLRHDIRSYWPQLGSLGMAQARLSPNGRPLAWALPLGRAHWLVLGLEFAELSRRLRQGAPDDDLRLRDRHGDGAVQTTDFVTLTELLQADAAWLDRWIDALLAAELGSMPWPRLWPASFAADGFLLVTHDERGLGERSHWMSRAEAAAGMSSTIFHAALDSLPASTSASARESGFEWGLSSRWPNATTWHDRQAPRHRYGLGPLRWLGRLPSVHEQRDRLQAHAPQQLLRAHSSYGLLWDARPDLPFEVLAAEGLEIDLSFGPDQSAAGWLFGSAVPFRPLALSGRLHRLYELPLLAIDTEGGLDGARLRRWFRHNAEGGHGPIALRFHPDSFAASPSAARFETWEALPQLAAQAAHSTLTVGELLDFWRARADTRLAVRWDGHWLEVTISPATAPQLSLPARALALPQQWRRLSLSSWQVDWPSPRSRRRDSYGSGELLLELPPLGGIARIEYVELP